MLTLREELRTCGAGLIAVGLAGAVAAPLLGTPSPVLVAPLGLLAVVLTGMGPDLVRRAGRGAALADGGGPGRPWRAVLAAAGLVAAGIALGATGAALAGGTVLICGLVAFPAAKAADEVGRRLGGALVRVPGTLRLAVRR